MEPRDPILSWSISLGTWFGVQLKLAVFSVFLALFILAKFQDDLRVALLLVLFVFATVIFHEFCHIWAARATGGSGEEILIWPFGGLAFVRPAASFQSQFVTAAAGPMSHVFWCGLSLSFALKGYTASQLLTPFVFPLIKLDDPGHPPLFASVSAMFFWVNWQFLLVNLLPAYPLDGWWMGLALGQRRWSKLVARTAMIGVSLICCTLLAITGNIKEWVSPLTLAFFLMILSLIEYFRLQLLLQRQFSDPALGLEEEDEFGGEEPLERQPGFLERWRQQREDKRQEKEAQERVATESRLDSLLQKIQESGMNSLTDEERRFLKQASTRYRGTEREKS